MTEVLLADSQTSVTLWEDAVTECRLLFLVCFIHSFISSYFQFSYIAPQEVKEQLLHNADQNPDMTKAIKHQLSNSLSICVVFQCNKTVTWLETWELAYVQTWSVLSTFMYTCHWNRFECDTKAIGWKVSQHLVPAAVLGRALLSSLPSDSQEPCSLTWVVLTFTALFKASHIPPFCFLWKYRKSCLQLFPALWTKEILQAHTVYSAGQHTSSSFVFLLSLSSGCPSLI